MCNSSNFLDVNSKLQTAHFIVVDSANFTGDTGEMDCVAEWKSFRFNVFDLLCNLTFGSEIDPEVAVDCFFACDLN